MKRFFFLAFALFVAMMSWEGQMTAAPVRDNGPIPQESIRLRILANSDSIQDQWVKREVRDAIVAQMNVWVKDIRSYEEAKQVVVKKLPELQALVDKTLKDRGFNYGAVVDFGEVPFPTKLYGSYVYPAGNYEALRVRIGEAKGKNWWCVLFPPLCFIDMSNGDAVQAEERQPADELPAATEPVDVETAAEEPIERKQPVKQQPAPEADESGNEEMNEAKDLRLQRLEREEADEVEETVATEETPLVSPAASETNEQQSIETDSARAVEKETAAAPQVEVRFFLWEKLTALF